MHIKRSATKRIWRTICIVLVLFLLLALLNAYIAQLPILQVIPGLFAMAWRTLLLFFILYVPAIWLLRRWCRRIAARWENGNEQKAKALNRFAKNNAALFGTVTILYACILSLCAHWIAPDKTPYANEQINEIAFKKPGFTVDLIKIPLGRSVQHTPFLQQGISGAENNYRLMPVSWVKVQDDTVVLKRYLGEDMEGMEMRMPLSDFERIQDNIHSEKSFRAQCVLHRTFYLGTDDLGRDYLSRILLGVRVSLSVGIVAVCIALLIGIPVGAIAGFYKRSPPRFKWRKKGTAKKVPVDDMVMWGINVIWTIPTLLLVFPIVFAFGQQFYTIFIAVGLTMWVDIARIVRGQVMQVREMEYVTAAKAFGFSDMRTIFRHILPNITGPVIVITAANFAYAILTEAGLSFLGIGVQPPAPGWGLMISKYKDNLITDPYLPLLPGFAITLLVLSFFLVGNGLRDALDVRGKWEN
ncbi:MAG: ABC transporter permease [Chitinophagales bacterium]